MATGIVLNFISFHFFSSTQKFNALEVFKSRTIKKKKSWRGKDLWILAQKKLELKIYHQLLKLLITENFQISLSQQDLQSIMFTDFTQITLFELINTFVG